MKGIIISYFIAVVLYLFAPLSVTFFIQTITCSPYPTRDALRSFRIVPVPCLPDIDGCDYRCIGDDRSCLCCFSLVHNSYR